MNNPTTERVDDEERSSMPGQENTLRGRRGSSSDEETVTDGDKESTIVELLNEAREGSTTPMAIGNGLVHDRYRSILREQAGEEPSDEASVDSALPRRATSPTSSMLSVPDDSPSVQGSVASSAGSSALPLVASRPGLNSPTPSFRPFDRRFQSRLSSSSSLNLHNSRPSSPAFLSGHSRSASISSQFVLDNGEADASTPPWEVVRWTRLRKLNGQAFSEVGKRNFGTPTCLAVSTSLVLGTSKGIILMFDYHQNLKLVIGPGTKAIECGAVTSLAISADHTTVAGGHANGYIFTWETIRASRPFLIIPHLDASQVQKRTMDGHVPDVAITHLGFLGTRRTALVSADDRGMAFSHLATRGTGSLGRTVKTTRILGRYPNAAPPVGKTLKPSTVLAFSSLPLGNVERATDMIGLTAMLTPYLLVIVSTTPVAQTQHKSARPKDVAPHSAMSGCLAWFPAVKLKVPDAVTGKEYSKVKLVYCWSNVLTVLDVDEIASEDKEKPPTLKFKARNRWTCEEAIVAVQWLSRSVLTVLTITQRLIVLEDRSMRMTDGFDLIHKHIFHTDLFSRQLHALVEQLDEDDASMHGVVADAFYMSFKAYKSRLFLLGFDEISIGALSNWTDRLVALIDAGEYVNAVQLATSYYTGDSDKLTVGLPEDATLRHSMVKNKVVEIMGAALRRVFAQRQNGEQQPNNGLLRDLAETCFVACQSIENTDFLFDEMYEWYEDADVEGIFLETLEPYILERTITMVPPTVVKAMVSHYVSKEWESRLEEMICHMETATLDLDQITLLCKQHSLYDALIYVWNQAMGDYITPLIDLLTLLVPLAGGGTEKRSAGNVMDDEMFGVNALKMFPYLSYTLTGRVYPTGEALSIEASTKASAELYWFLFSGKTIAWPKGSSKPFLTGSTSRESEPSFPYLRLILQFDAPSFLSALNEAFEDSFLNESPEKQTNGTIRGDLPEEQIFGLTVDRQYIVSILLEIMNPNAFTPEDSIYLNMFIARNLPKFPQYLLFPGSTLNKVLAGLCEYPGRDLAEDAQLSAEYLLSVYQPPDVDSLMPLFKKAGFYRILKRIYRVDKQFGKLVQAYFDDPDDRDATFECIAECLRPHSLTHRQLKQVEHVIRQNAKRLVELDPKSAAKTLSAQDTELHHHILESVDDEPELQYTYLKTLLEPEITHGEEEDGPSAARHVQLVEQYVRLMCRYDAAYVADYIGQVQSASLRLDRLLPTMEETGVIDAAVKLMAREGMVTDAMERLVKHLHTLESALQGLLTHQTAAEADQVSGMQCSAEELLAALQKYVHVGIWLCQGRTRVAVEATGKQKPAVASRRLSADEELWLTLIDATVQVTCRLSPVFSTSPDEGKDGGSQGQIDNEKLLALLRSLVQHTFTALLTATSSSSNPARPEDNVSFLRILGEFLTRAASSSPSLADLRAVLASIFSAYAYEQSILGLSNLLLERSLFASVSRAVELRQRGWRPRGSTCEACGGRVWGPGVGTRIVDAWEEKRIADEERRKERREQNESDENDGKGAKGKGKGKGVDSLTYRRPAAVEDGEVSEGGSPREKPLDQLVLLACRHIYHRRCLDALQEEVEAGKREYKCPIDG